MSEIVCWVVYFYIANAMLRSNNVDILSHNDNLTSANGELFWGFCMSNYRLLIVVFALALLQGYHPINNASAEEDWDFTGKHLPDAQILAKYDAQYFELTCADRTDLMYENYAKLHPAFRKYLGDAQMRKKWRIALISGSDLNLDSFNQCFYRKLRRRWTDALITSKKKSLIFCGRIVENLNELDQYAAEALREMTRYAIIGRAGAISTIFISLKDNKRARLNSEIVYYMQRHLQADLDNHRSISEKLATSYRNWLKPDAGLDLDPTRKYVLDEAFIMGDHLKMFETTAPCQEA